MNRELTQKEIKKRDEFLSLMTGVLIGFLIATLVWCILFTKFNLLI